MIRFYMCKDTHYLLLKSGSHDVITLFKPNSRFVRKNFCNFVQTSKKGKNELIINTAGVVGSLL